MNRSYPAAAGAGAVPRSLLVLGATGTLGRHVTAALRAAGDAVTPLSRGGPDPLDLTTTAPDELADLLHRYRPDVVVNASGRIWHATEEELWAVNAEAVARLAGVMAALPWRPRLVHLGSVHEYGPGEPGTGIGENRAPAPVTPYGRAKLGGTRAVLEAVRDQGLDAVVLRVANVFGPGMSPSSLLGGVAERLARAERGRNRDDPPLRLRLAPLRARRDFVDVRDVADAVVAVARVRTVTEAPAPHEGDATGTLGMADTATAAPTRHTTATTGPAHRRDSADTADLATAAHPRDTAHTTTAHTRGRTDTTAPAPARDTTRTAAAADAGRTRRVDPVINVGSGTAVPMRDVVDRLIALSAVPVLIEPAAPQDPRRVDVEWQQLDTGRARRLLHWRPRRDPDASLRDLLATQRQATTEGLR
ncbi:NAD-dependent epimerase/dehydratase [Streptomyces deccanensis]|uniref:NAD-dependent epimerase/dehydratase n=1 Tax=Streptomyces deccanensis TaxID=424188 RepID=UPI001EFBB66B|nr:NAD-dependent epimerase/dehydratase family protein [Streptomyces deccanensis]ULR51521.1 NAD-dependent epimerase/dehydratase [Streptomyces deccanensis]